MRAAWILFLVGCGGTGAAPVGLRDVVLYQNGMGYFEHAGHASGDVVRLHVQPHELDDVLTTLTVVDESADGATRAPTAVLPEPGDEDGRMALSVRLGATSRDVRVAYAAQTAAWRASYRLVLPDEEGGSEALLQGWAVVDNTTAEDWDEVLLTLATAAPLSFAVDLRTPRIVERPNVTGYMAPPVAFGPVFAERVDTDHDGIVDTDDAETWNGYEDEDGLPDRGRVIVQGSSLQILERVWFEEGSSVLRGDSRPVVAAVAQTLLGNPDLGRVEIHGHADGAEAHAWSLSAERAAVVRSALVDAGVPAERLEVVPHGATQPHDGRGTPEGRAQNRRVEWRLDRAVPPPRATGGLRARSLERTMRSASLPVRAGGGGTRFVLRRRISIPAGRSAMVAMLAARVGGEDVLLFRPDASVAESTVHPFRAARLRNGQTDLAPGPIALFARGELLGQGLLEGLRAGATAFVPYGVDGGSRVEVEVSEEEVPARLLAVVLGRLRIERTRIRRTRYTIEPGRQPPRLLFLRHARTPGFEPLDLPPRTERSPEAMLVPVPIEPRRRHELVLDERQPVVVDLDLTSDFQVDLGRYAIGDGIDPAVRARLDALLEDRRVLADLHGQVRALRQRLAETGARTAELRASVAALAEAGGTAPMRARIARMLQAAVADGEALAAELAELRVRQLEATEGLREAARGFDADLQDGAQAASEPSATMPSLARRATRRPSTSVPIEGE